jgi:hypothetical protein
MNGNAHDDLHGAPHEDEFHAIVTLVTAKDAPLITSCPAHFHHHFAQLTRIHAVVNQHVLTASMLCITEQTLVGMSGHHALLCDIRNSVITSRDENVTVSVSTFVDMVRGTLQQEMDARKLKIFLAELVANEKVFGLITERLRKFIVLFFACHGQDDRTVDDVIKSDKCLLDAFKESRLNDVIHSAAIHEVLLQLRNVMNANQQVHATL